MRRMDPHASPAQAAQIGGGFVAGRFLRRRGGRGCAAPAGAPGSGAPSGALGLRLPRRPRPAPRTPAHRGSQHLPASARTRPSPNRTASTPDLGGTCHGAQPLRMQGPATCGSSRPPRPPRLAASSHLAETCAKQKHDGKHAEPGGNLPWLPAPAHAGTCDVRLLTPACEGRVAGRPVRREGSRRPRAPYGAPEPSAVAGPLPAPRRRVKNPDTNPDTRTQTPTRPPPPVTSPHRDPGTDT